MDTKWKKRNVSAVLCYVIGISLLIAGGLGVLKDLIFSSDWRASARQIEKDDFQETAAFQEFIERRLYDFLAMACGEYVNSEYAYYYAARSVQEQEADVTEGAAWKLDMTSEEWEEQEDWEYTDKERKTFAERFHQYLKGDKNLFYRISYKGKLLYSNMDGNEGNFHGYNFYLHFDGTDVSIKKDGEELDVYGDRVYREKEGWRVPGYNNLTVKDAWRDVDIVMQAVKEPVTYEQELYDGGVSSNELYGLYYEYLNARGRMKRSFAFLGAGLLSLLLYACLKKERGLASKWAAGVTAKIWFEWKALLFLLLPILLLAGVRSSPFYMEMMDELNYAYAVEAGSEAFGEYSPLLLRGVLDALCSRLAQAVLIFWLFYLFFNDLRRNKGSCQNGGFGKLFALLSEKSLSLPLSKRMVRRTYGVFAVTFLLFLLFVCFFVAFLFMDGYFGVYMGPFTFWLLLLALAGVALLLAAEYAYLRKNREMAEGMHWLANRIHEIHDGKYAAWAGCLPQDRDIRPMAQELEEIGQGLETAVCERTRSERMKVELIANVSHDIKTPLTSIISYIQLLKQEEGLPAHVKDYVQILDEKSERLKNMVQDVFAVSKAASGQLTVELEELDLGKLLYQTLADMDEEIQKSAVTVRADIPKGPVLVRADGQRMYRVFQNLIGNAVKYSLEGSRAYVTLKEEGEFAAASVKNTSSQELSGDVEFAERFVRGDRSRSDGGSGLGLSIAKSFTEACGGEFHLETIADLFVVTVSFRQISCQKEG